MIWFLADLARVARERAAIDQLQSQPDAWLKNVAWKITPLLEADADIEINGQLYPITLTYPYVFPACPPAVFPRGVDTRWSYHQYGRGGELCLEWGPDNWNPTITGADMLASAHKLLSLENPAPQSGQESAVPSRDAPTFAQQVRGAHRFTATQGLLERLEGVPIGQPAKFCVCVSGVRRCLAAVTRIECPGVPAWKDDRIPASALDGLIYQGAAIRFPADTPDFPLDDELPALREALARVSIDVDELRGSGTVSFFLLLHIAGKTPGLVWLHGDSFSSFSTVFADHNQASRLADEYARLCEKSVCIVGCGSVGSKIATSLARAGVGRFDLIDDDVFLCGNLVRNDLDWRSLGSHKPDALSRRLRLVRPEVTVTVHRVRLNGQASSTRMAAALRAAAECDLIIDATADATVFNLLAAIAAKAGKAMMWAEVFGGGVGGMMARFRPTVTPTPTRMRAIINQWCTDQGRPWIGRERGYETEDGSGTLLVADDADAAVIAAHATRYALDNLLGNEPPEYTYAAYLIGLKRAWIFSEPFDTHPIDVGLPEEETPPIVLSDDQVTDTSSFLATLIAGMMSANPTSG